MDAHSDATRTIRSQLCQAVLRLEADSCEMSDAAIVRRLSEIERIARDHGLTPLARAPGSARPAASLP